VFTHADPRAHVAFGDLLTFFGRHTEDLRSKRAAVGRRRLGEQRANGAGDVRQMQRRRGASEAAMRDPRAVRGDEHALRLRERRAVRAKGFRATVIGRDEDRRGVTLTHACERAIEVVEESVGTAERAPVAAEVAAMGLLVRIAEADDEQPWTERLEVAERNACRMHIGAVVAQPG